MEAWQHVQPTGPNRAIELAPHRQPGTKPTHPKGGPLPSRPQGGPLRRPGDRSGGAPPDPIPNSVVKAPSADGTASQDAGEQAVAGSSKRPAPNTPSSSPCPNPTPHGRGHPSRASAEPQAARGDHPGPPRRRQATWGDHPGSPRSRRLRGVASRGPRAGAAGTGWSPGVPAKSETSWGR